MRYLLIPMLIIACLGSAYAFELGTQQNLEKDSSHAGQNPGTPDGREGGEDMATAFQIQTIPFFDIGNTTGHVNDYDAVCPYSGSTAPDLVYYYQPTEDIILSVDLCGSGYDTKTYIYAGSGDLVFCNDDYYSDETCGQYVSLIQEAYLFGGTTYYFVIDGYGEESGNYILNINEITPEPPCVLECSGVAEGEPTLSPGYVDAFNGGCNSPEFGEPWGDLVCDPDVNGDLTFCGKSGWIDSGRDTDWYYLMVGEYGMVEVSVDAEQLTYVFTLTMTSCDDVAVDQSMIVGICAPGQMTIQGNPGDIFMMWFGATEFTPPAGFVGNEYSYVAEFTGLDPCDYISTERATMDRIKSLYR